MQAVLSTFNWENNLISTSKILKKKRLNANSGYVKKSMNNFKFNVGTSSLSFVQFYLSKNMVAPFCNKTLHFLAFLDMLEMIWDSRIMSLDVNCKWKLKPNLGPMESACYLGLQLPGRIQTIINKG